MALALRNLRARAWDPSTLPPSPAAGLPGVVSPGGAPPALQSLLAGIGMFQRAGWEL